MKLRLNLKLSQKGLILVSVPLAFELLFVVILAMMLYQAEKEIEREAKARSVITRANQAIEKILTTAAGGALLNMSGSMDSLVYEKHLEEVPAILQGLSDDLKDEPVRAQSAQRVALMWESAAADAKELKHLRFSGDQFALLKKVKRLQRLVAGMTGELHKIVHDERPAQEESIKRQALLRRNVFVLIAVSVLFNIILAIMLAVFFNRSTLRRLDILLDNSVRLGAGKPLNALLDGGDEIAQVDKVFHLMAQELEAAQQKERALLEQAIASENRTRRLIDSMPVGLIVMGSKGNILSANPATESMLGFGLDDLKHLKLSDLLTDLGTQSPGEYIKELIEEASGHICEKTARRKSGDEFPLELTVTEYEAGDDRLFLCIMLDLSERQEILRLKREFVSIVSHELRTPVTSVRAFLVLLKTGAYGDLPEPAMKKLEQIERNMERLIRLINDLLQVETYVSGNLELDMVELNLKNVIERSMEEVRPLAVQNEVVLSGHADDLIVRADEDRIIQVVVNFLSNAIKFSPRGGKVSVEARLNGDSLKISVSDEGPGIPARHKAAVFEKFHQVNSSDRKEKGGSGLGLAIARAIVDGHGGKIGLDSEVGSGSTFWFTLPLETAVLSGEING